MPPRNRPIRLLAPLVLVALGLPAPGLASAAFPGAAGNIVYTRGESFGAQVVMVAPDGSPGTGVERDLSTDLYGSYAQAPSYSPDGRYVAFTTAYGADIYIVDVTSTDPKFERRALGVGSRTASAWSPDGKRIAFAKGADNGMADLFTVRVSDGGDLQRVTTFSAAFGSADDPDWSPDGSRIAFRGIQRVQTGTDGNGNPIYENRQGIWSVGADGTSPTLLAGGDRAGVSYCCPDYSPDGSQIAYSSDVGGGNDVYVMPAGGGPSTVLVAGASDPAFSPDGTQIAFNWGLDVARREISGGTVIVESSGCSGNFACGGPDWGVEPPITGTPGDDEITGTPGDDVIIAGDGNDEIDGGGGDDVILGGPGNDTLIGGAGADEIEGGSGNDLIVGDAPASAAARAALTRRGVEATASSAAGADDILDGGGGKDQVFGGGGVDDVIGGGGNDKTYGDDGDDDLAGNKGDDLLVGGVGRDNMNGGGGTDRCFKGSGDRATSCETITKRHR